MKYIQEQMRFFVLLSGFLITVTTSFCMNSRLTQNAHFGVQKDQSINKDGCIKSYAYQYEYMTEVESTTTESPPPPPFKTNNIDMMWGGTTVSNDNVKYDNVLSGLNTLYPPDDLNSRNSMSRKDGYWSFISTGDEPPLHLTYGEFDFSFFAELLERSKYHYMDYNDNDRSNNNPKNDSGWNDKTFLDIGSGTGRLVIGAAALYPQWALCRGIEILPGIHETAVQSLEKCLHGGGGSSESSSNDTNGYHSDASSATTTATASYTNEEWKMLSMGAISNSYSERNIDCSQRSKNNNNNNNNNKQKVTSQSKSKAKSHSLSCPQEEDETFLPLAPIDFSCGSFEDPQEDIGSADLIFVFSTCWTEELMTSLSECIRRECKPGTVAITTEFQLPSSLTVDSSHHDEGGSTASGLDSKELELVEKVDGLCSVTGGLSTAYIHRVI